MGGFLLGFGFFGRGGGFGGGRFAFFAEAGLFYVGGFGVRGVVLGFELVECGDDDVAVGEVGAGEERFAEARFAGSEVAVAADGRAGRKIFGFEGRFAFFGDVDDPFALGIAGAAKERAKASVAERHGGGAGGAGLRPVEIGVVVVAVEIERFDRGCEVAGGIIGAAVEVFVAGPNFLELLSALGAVDFGEEFGDGGFFLGFVDEGDKVLPEIAEEFFPVFVVFGDLFELIFHLGGEGDVHDGREVLFEHGAYDFAELGGFESLALFDGVVAALDFVHDGRVGGGAADAEALKLFDEGRFGEPGRRFGE